MFVALFGAVKIGHIDPDDIFPGLIVMLGGFDLRQRQVFRQMFYRNAMVMIESDFPRSGPLDPGSGDSFACQTVEQGTLAHAGTAHEGDNQRPGAVMVEQSVGRSGINIA